MQEKLKSNKNTHYNLGNWFQIVSELSERGHGQKEDSEHGHPPRLTLILRGECSWKGQLEK